MAAIHFRIAGYITTMVMHITNVVYMLSCFQGPVMKNSYVKHFSEMQCFFFTCWTFTFQTVYSAVALYSDLLALKNCKSGDEGVPKLLVDLRETFFTILVWPCTILTTSVFWPMFIFDRGLFYPADIDLAIPLASNHIMHSAIAVATLWEALFRPRVNPEVHWWRMLAVWMVEVTYIVVLLGVYLIKGVWVYPIFRLLIGSVYFYLFFVAIAVLLIFIYHAQWAFDRLVWGPTDGQTGPRVNVVMCLAQRTLNAVIMGSATGGKKGE